jgi:hypothetical protein
VNGRQTIGNEYRIPTNQSGVIASVKVRDEGSIDHLGLLVLITLLVITCVC